ncbi:methyl-accepting chemotaxis protein [Kineococcus arenarius]|uniref:methyl-accepting chemotaxis protein n=1 Tax=Kineococcus sp. SYSU DK021 TaxID=3383142 RepID=UPI003D7ECBB5
MPRLTIGRRIGAGFAVIVLLMVALTAFGASRVGEIDQRLTTINDLNAVKSRYAINFRGSVHDRAIAVRDVVLADSSAGVDEQVATIEELAEAYDESAAAMAEVFSDPAAVDDAERAALADIEAVQARTLPLIEQVVSLKRSGDEAAAEALLTTQAAPAFVDWLASINVFIDMEEAKNQVESTEARAVSAGFLKAMLAVCALAAVLAAVVAWRITRNLTRRIGRAAEVLAAAEQGDLTQRLEPTTDDELCRMSRSLNAALGSIGEVMGAFERSATGLSGTSRRIGELSQCISTGAVQSAAQADVVAGAAGEVSRNVQGVADGAAEMGTAIQEIARNTSEAAAVAAQAVEAMSATTGTVQRLGESSREIGEVVKVITAIAEQTNLLALNATIEAARAGEMGKGFAVVASEVKDLAQETARATESISARVQAIQADTSSAADAITAVTGVIGQIDQYQTTIAAAVEEQTATTAEMSRGTADAAGGSEQIAANIGAVAAVARSTQESVAESERAVGDLDAVAAELQALVGRFGY